MARDCIYIVGAGFSAGLGYPLTADLLQRLWPLLNDDDFRSSLKKVIEFHYHGFDPEHFSSFPNVEQLLSQMEVNDQFLDMSRYYIGEFTREKLRDLQQQFLLCIADWFSNLTIGVRSGKAKASRESGGFLPWTEDDMAAYRAKWPLGTEARLMFDILHYTFLRLGDAHRFGPPHLRQVVRKMAVQIATEKSHGNTTVTVPVHPAFAESLRAARAARIIGADVFTGKMMQGRVLPMNKEAWAADATERACLARRHERQALVDEDRVDFGVPGPLQRDRAAAEPALEQGIAEQAVLRGLDFGPLQKS
jgi:hypothetical protein